MDQSAFKKIEELYVKLYPSLRRYAQSCLHNESLAEEAVQEAFRIACSKPENVLLCPKPEGWLIVTVRNVCNNIHRRREADKKLLLEYFATHSNQVEGCCDAEDIGLLYGSLANTPEFQLIRSMAIDGKSMKEIASEQGISLEACYKRVQRARATLKKKL